MNRYVQLSTGFGIVTALFIAAPWPGGAAEPPIADSAREQIHALVQEKLSRSALHQRLDSHFVFKLKQNRHQISDLALTNLESRLKFEVDGRLLVDIDANVTDALLGQIRQSGGTVLSSVPRFHAIRALVALDQLEGLAASGDVKFIRRAVKSRHRTGSVESQGDITHGANLIRSQLGVSGAGVTLGVLSDSVDFLSNSQSSGDLGTVTVLSGQSGVPGTGEGTAMLEIIHDVAPGAALYFATAASSEASFAQNILDLQSAGCNIILDDEGYFDESPFQDGIIAQAVNTVTAAGALYFSAAGNDGNADNGTSSTWEGDFASVGTIGSPINNRRYGESGALLHTFGSATYNKVISSHSGVFDAVLFWADPLGGSANDYDLFVLTSSGSSVYDYSNNPQTGTQDPFETCTAAANDRVVVVKYSGFGRFLHLAVFSDGESQLTFQTSGNTLGHACATNAYGVAAVDAQTAYPNLFTTANVVENFSSDGPRRVYFNADGSAITPGNFSSTGGAVRQKPDLAAADGVSVSVTGFQPLFYGTSAATPHAAAIAALLMSYRPGLTPAQIRSILTGNTLDIMASGWDRDSGAGIVMATTALQAVSQPPQPVISSIVRTNGTVRLTWSASAGHMYQLQSTPGLSPAAWGNVGSAVTASNATVSAADSISTNSHRFYRVSVVN